MKSPRRKPTIRSTAFRDHDQRSLVFAPVKAGDTISVTSQTWDDLQEAVHYFCGRIFMEEMAPPGLITFVDRMQEEPVRCLTPKLAKEANEILEACRTAFDDPDYYAAVKTEQKRRSREVPKPAAIKEAAEPPITSLIFISASHDAPKTVQLVEYWVKVRRHRGEPAEAIEIVSGKLTREKMAAITDWAQTKGIRVAGFLDIKAGQAEHRRRAPQPRYEDQDDIAF